MNFKITFLIFLFCLFFSPKAKGESLSPTIDSLAVVLKKSVGKQHIEALNAIAWEYRNIRPEQALKYVEQSLLLAQVKGFERELADAYRIKAGVHWNMGSYMIATEYAFQGLKVFEAIRDTVGIANSYIILGNIYNKQENIPFSLDYYEKALAIFRKLKVQNRVAACLNNLASAFTKRKQYKTAISYLAEAIEINNKLNTAQSKNSLTHNFNNLGYLYYKQGTYDTALVYLHKVYQICDEIGDESVFMVLQEAYLTYSYIYFEKKQYKISLDYAKKALASAEQTEHKLSIRDAYKQLATVFAKQKNIEMAHEFEQRYISLNDSIFNEESMKHVAALQAQYESTYKDKEIISLQEERIAQQSKIDQQKLFGYLLGISIFFVLVIAIIFYKNHRNQKKINTILESKNREIEQQKHDLENLNATKDKFFSIVAHDLRSPLNSLKGFSNFLANYTDGMTSEEIKKIATDLNHSVNNTLDLTNNLLAWARLQMDRADFSPVLLDLNEIIQANASFFRAVATAKNNELNTELPPALKVLADEDCLNFILRNLIANAVKFTQNGKILLSATLKEQLVEIAIADTGRGIDASLMDKIFSVAYKSTTLGTAGEKGTGLGLPLCKEFIEKNGGTIWVASTVGKGSTFFFTLKVA